MQQLLSLPSENAPAATRPCDDHVRSLLFKIVCSLVDHPDQVELVQVTSDEGVAFQVRSTAKDLINVVGRNGHTARAIRTVLCASGSRTGRKYTLDIVL